MFIYLSDLFWTTKNIILHDLCVIEYGKKNSIDVITVLINQEEFFFIIREELFVLQQHMYYSIFI